MILCKQIQIDNSMVSLFDGLQSDLEMSSYVKALDGAPFTRTEIATHSTAHQKHFVCEMPVTNLTHLPLFKPTLGALSQHACGSYRPYRSYTNLALPNDVLYAHTDCHEHQRDITALWYLCTQWNKDWAGETVFFDAHDEIVASILPKPGRLVLFDGRVRHAGRPPSRIAEEARYTFAIKFEPI